MQDGNQRPETSGGKMGERIRHFNGPLEMERSRFLSRQRRKIFSLGHAHERPRNLPIHRSLLLKAISMVSVRAQVKCRTDYRIEKHEVGAACFR